MDESVLSTYSEAVLMRLDDEFKQSERGYRVTPLGGDRYKVSYTGDGKEHMPHSVSWCTEENSLGTPIPTCTCSLHASGGYPCRHIISVAVARGEKIKTSFFNDRLEKDQVPFMEGRKLASVNYSTVQRVCQHLLHQGNLTAVELVEVSMCLSKKCFKTSSLDGQTQ